MYSIPDPETQPTVAVWPTAARALGLSKSAAYAAAKAGRIPTIRLGERRVRVPTAALRSLLGLDQRPTG